jgi:hypothetical protein
MTDHSVRLQGGPPLFHTLSNLTRIVGSRSATSRIHGENLMKKYLSVLLLLSAGLTVGASQASAETSATPPKAEKKKAPKKAAAKKADDEKAPDIAGRIRTDFNCDLGDKVTIYENDSDDKRIALRWNKKVHELTRVDTTTGANRFENKDAGLVWINIPAKGMLLDSKKGRQLANECKNPVQITAQQPSA